MSEDAHIVIDGSFNFNKIFSTPWNVCVVNNDQDFRFGSLGKRIRRKLSHKNENHI